MTTPQTIDESGYEFLSGVFKPITTEVFASELQVVQGALPYDLNGTYLRNGPNPRFTPLGGFIYPLEGDGMIHSVSLENGYASYRNAFVRTPMVTAEEKVGHALWKSMSAGFLPDPGQVDPDLAARFRDMPTVNVACHHGRLIALAEATRSYRISPLLATLDVEDFGGAFPDGSAAHPKVDPRTGELFTFMYSFEAPFLSWVVLNPDGSTKSGPNPVPSDTCHMVHDFAITETKVVLAIHPAVFDIQSMVTGGAPMQWRPELGSKIAVISRDDPSDIEWHTGAAHWTWHFANAYDTDDSVDLEAVVWSNIGFDLAPDLPPAETTFERFTLKAGSTEIERQVIATRSFEFPRIDDRLIGTRHSQVALGARGAMTNQSTTAYDGVLTIDTQTGEESFFQAQGMVVGEPCFVPATSGTHGYYVTFATQLSDMSSYFLVLASDDVAAGPIATIRLPQRVPMGLHGAWVPAEQMASISPS